MHIVYDHQIFSTQEYGGISRYVVELARQLDDADNTRATILAPVHMNAFLRFHPPAGVVGAYAPPYPRTARVRRLVNDALSRAWLRMHRPSVIHETYYRRDSLATNRIPSVVTVYDMIHERFAYLFPGSDPTARDKAAAVQRAGAVICISEQARRDLLDLLPVSAEKVSVVHLAHSPRPTPLAGYAVELRDPYLLYVGHRRAYKNFSTLLQAIAASEPLRRGFRLVCFGGGSFTPAEWEMARALGFDADSLVHLEGRDERLASLYSHAAALVYPSLYEGFGIPILEAMGYGCPVACSATSSLPEVGGDAAEYFNPTSPEDMAAAIRRIVDSSSHADALRSRGLQRVTLFSWSRCARETRSVYERLL
ncbi:MAG: glycosyltransferase family 4 protein [Gemmatimonadaceae bacterium]